VLNHPCVRRFCLLLGCSLLLPSLGAGGQSNQGQFDAFFASFKAAVASKDSVTLEKLMAAEFDYFQAHKVAPADVFKSLDAQNGQQWANLQSAVQNQPVKFKDGYGGKPARALQCTPTNVIYRCYVVFQQDTQHHWKWKAMIMPQH